MSAAGTVVTTVASYVGLWVGAGVVIGLIELYGNPAAPADTSR